MGPVWPPAETRAEAAADAGDGPGDDIVARAVGGPLDRAQTPHEAVLRPDFGRLPEKRIGSDEGKSRFPGLPGVQPDRQHAPLSACAALVTTLAARTRVYFSYGSAEVAPGAKEAVEVLAAAVRLCPDVHVTVLGFADPAGDAVANRALSLARAKAVQTVMAHVGFSGTRLHARSHLDGHPESCLHFDVVDRRVEFEVSLHGETLALAN
ncbi:OmpA family protein [Tropicibacter sp. S64]|uniref:OmpA family protein n=1 Tax=Tropicibacter sp. S64 TaxID=3415122 RepID=UPI003C7AE3A0